MGDRIPKPSSEMYKKKVWLVEPPLHEQSSYTYGVVVNGTASPLMINALCALCTYHYYVPLSTHPRVHGTMYGDLSMFEVTLSHT